MNTLNQKIKIKKKKKVLTYEMQIDILKEGKKFLVVLKAEYFQE